MKRTLTLPPQAMRTRMGTTIPPAAEIGTIHTNPKRKRGNELTPSLARIIHGRVGCVEQARATVRLRSQGRLLIVDSVSRVPPAACADAPLTCPSLTHPA